MVLTVYSELCGQMERERERERCENHVEKKPNEWVSHSDQNPEDIIYFCTYSI